jgi:NADPH:quinone reductase-like Zn-dependent oxidoreductase
MHHATSILATALTVVGASITTCSAGDALPADMIAIHMEQHGPAEGLRQVRLPLPKPLAGEVLVRVRAAGVNPVDWRIRSGSLGDFPRRPPLVLGYDLAGDVAAHGDGVTGPAIGTPVYAMLPLDRPGSYAEYVAISADLVVAKPKRLTYAQAAAVPLPALTAYQGLVTIAELKAGQTVLIHGSAGGVGHFAVQIAKALGAQVIATGSDYNADFIRALGADRFINYRTERFDALVRDADVGFDIVGGETLQRTYSTVRRGGIVVSCLDTPQESDVKHLGVRAVRVQVEPSPTRLAAIGAWIDAGRITPDINRVSPPAEVAAAHLQSESMRTRGRIILDFGGANGGAVAVDAARPSAP